jgi:hypothetical protein
MSTKAVPPDVIPPRLRWFAVWKWKRRWRLCLILALLWGYPLSVGPTIWLCKHGYLPAEVFIAYRPVRLFANLSDPMQSALAEYARWWDALP